MRRRRPVRLRARSIPLRLLRLPLATTHDEHRARRSRFVWVDREDVYVLTPLAVLHRLFGFNVDVIP